MRHILLVFICLILISNKTFSQQNLQMTQLDFSCDTLVVQTWVWFSFGYQSTCPQLTYYEVISYADTMELKLYYNISGVWPQVGCERVDTITSVILPDVTILKGVAYSINDNDTTIESETQIPICNPTGIGTTYNESAFEIFPNPFSSHLNIQISYNKQVTIILYNLLGNKILQQTFMKSALINAEHLPAGIYIYELRNDIGIVEYGKIIKK